MIDEGSTPSARLGISPVALSQRRAMTVTFFHTSPGDEYYRRPTARDFVGEHASCFVDVSRSALPAAHQLEQTCIQMREWHAYQSLEIVAMTFLRVCAIGRGGEDERTVRCAVNTIECTSIQSCLIQVHYRIDDALLRSRESSSMCVESLRRFSNSST